MCEVQLCECNSNNINLFVIITMMDCIVIENRIQVEGKRVKTVGRSTVVHREDKCAQFHE